MNDIKLSGYLVKDPIFGAYDYEGKKVKKVNFVLSVYRGQRTNSETGKVEKIRDLFLCKASGKTAELMENYFYKKGTKVLVSEAKMLTDKFIPKKYQEKAKGLSPEDIQKQGLYQYITYCKVKKIEFMADKLTDDATQEPPKNVENLFIDTDPSQDDENDEIEAPFN